MNTEAVLNRCFHRVEIYFQKYKNYDLQKVWFVKIKIFSFNLSGFENCNNLLFSASVENYTTFYHFLKIYCFSNPFGGFFEIK